MPLFINFAILWICLSVLILATGWYAASILRSYCPRWWHRVVVDIDPYFEAQQKRLQR
jgi:hypothetical protein